MQIPNCSYASFRKNGSTVIFMPMRLMFFGVGVILFNRTVCKICSFIVIPVTVKMPNNKPIWARANEYLRNQLMYVKRFLRFSIQRFDRNTQIRRFRVQLSKLTPIW